MSEQMERIEGLLERFGENVDARPKRRRLSFKLVNRAEDEIPSIEESAKRALCKRGRNVRILCLRREIEPFCLREMGSRLKEHEQRDAIWQGLEGDVL